MCSTDLTDENRIKSNILLEWKDFTGDHERNCCDSDGDEKLHNKKQSERCIIVIPNGFATNGQVQGGICVHFERNPTRWQEDKSKRT